MEPRRLEKKNRQREEKRTQNIERIQARKEERAAELQNDDELTKLRNFEEHAYANSDDDEGNEGEGNAEEKPVPKKGGR